MNSSNNSNRTEIQCNPINNEPWLDDIQTCYLYFISNNIIATTLEYFLGVATIVANCLVFSMIYKKKDKKAVFDKILMAHSIVDFVVGAIDLPFYHVFTVFNYWPFSEVLCILWNSLDTALFSISMLMMLYMAFVRTMSIVRPTTYLTNIFVRNTFVMTSMVWFVSLFYWGLINTFYVTIDYSYGNCSIPYNPLFTQFLYFFFGVFIPLCLIIILTVYVALEINKKQKIKRQNHKVKKKDTATTSASANPATNKSKIKKRFRLTPETRLTIIVTVYIIQYAPSCFIFLINSLCGCIPNEVSTFTYWLTYTASLTDPITILILNPNYKIKIEKK